MRINQTSYLVTETTLSELTISCKGKIQAREKLKGTAVVSMDPGCIATSDHLIIKRESYEADVKIDSTFGTTPLHPDKVFPHQLSTEWIATAKAYLSNVGRPVDPQSIDHLVSMEDALRKLDSQRSGSGPSLFSILWHAIPTLLLILLVAVMIYLSRKIYVCYQRRRKYEPAPREPAESSAPMQSARTSHTDLHSNAAVSLNSNAMSADDTAELARLRLERDIRQQQRDERRRNKQLRHDVPPHNPQYGGYAGGMQNE